MRFIIDNSIDYYTIRKNDIKDIFEFEQKFLHDVKETCFERYKLSIKLKLRNHVVLHKFQDIINKEYLLDNDYFYSYEIGNFLMFHIVFFPKDNENFTFQVTEIKNKSKKTVLKINEEQCMSLINHELINRNFPFKDIKAALDDDMLIDDRNESEMNSSDPCVQFQEVIKVVKSSIQNNLLPFFFKKLQDYLEKLISKQYKHIANLKLENDDIIIYFKFEQKFETYCIKFSKFVVNNRCFIKILFSHKYYENTMINNFKEIISFNELNETAFDLKISEGLKGFYQNQYDRILGNLRLFECNELEVSYILSDYKISCFLSKDFMLFSLSIDNKGVLNFIDESKLFRADERSKILENISLLNRRNNLDMTLIQVNDFYLYLKHHPKLFHFLVCLFFYSFL